MDGYTKYLKKGKVKILGHNYSFVEISNLARDNKAAGRSCGNAQFIQVEPSLPLSNKQSTFIHEILEQLDYLLELNMPHDKLQALEAGLFAVVTDNQGIFDFTTASMTHSQEEKNEGT